MGRGGTRRIPENSAKPPVTHSLFLIMAAEQPERGLRAGGQARRSVGEPTELFVLAQMCGLGGGFGHRA